MAYSAINANSVQPLGGPNTGNGTDQGDGWDLAVSKLNSMLSELYARTGGSLTAPGEANFKNLLDGADFTINPWQRGTSFTLIGATLTYTADRWFMVAGAASSATVAKTSNSALLGFSQSLVFGRAQTAGSTSTITIGQVCESLDSIKTQGQVVNFSFWAQANTGWAANSNNVLLARIIQGFGTDQSASAGVNGTWTGQSNVVSAQTALTNVLTQYTFSGTVANSCSQIGVLLSYVPQTQTALANETITLIGPQLEIGGPSPFEHRDVEVELALCQRYFYQINEGTSASFIGAGLISGANSAQFVMSLPAQMRVAPTVSVVSTGSFAANILGTLTSLTGMAAGSTHTPNFINVTGNVTAASGLATMLVSRQPNSGVITASADL